MSKVLTDGNDLNPALAAADFVVYALNGNDVVFSDLIQAHLYGGDGSDFLGAQNNATFGTFIYGGAGNDTGHGTPQADHLYGDDGDDLLVGGEFTYATAASTGQIVPYLGELSGDDYIDGGLGRDGSAMASTAMTPSTAEMATTARTAPFPPRATPAAYLPMPPISYTLIKAGLYGGDGNDFLDGGRGDDSLFGGNDNDTLYGGDGNDDLHGQVGDDTEAGGFGDDQVDGGPGNDTLLGGFGNDTLTGGPGDDRALGGEGDDTLNGADGNDFLRGGDGNDLIDGGLGNDVLAAMTARTPSSSRRALGPTIPNVDTILDFEPGIDTIALSLTIFTGIGGTAGGGLSRGQFHIGSKARDHNDHIIYNAKNGKLFYDDNGSQSGHKVLFAILDNHLDLHASDFSLIA